MNNNKRSPNLIIVFLGTLGATVLIGLCALLIINGIKKGGLKNVFGRDDEVTLVHVENDAAGNEAYTPANGRNTEPLPEEDVRGDALQTDSGDTEGDADAEAEADTDAYSYIYKGVTDRYGDDLDDPEYLASQRIHILDSRDGDGEHVTLTFGGDILFDDEYAVYSKLLQNGGQINAGIDQSLINIMKSSDVTMVNNEFPYTDRGTPTEGKTYTFRADTSTVHLLTDMGANVAGIANNHAYDFGRESFLDTLDTLEAAGIPYTGGGRNISEASAPLYFVIDDIKIGIIASTQIERLDNPDTRGATDTEPGVFRCLNPDRLLKVVSEMKEKCDFVVVFIHWGTESTNEVDWLQTDQAPKIAQAGADLIIGAHPHVLQPIGTSGGIPVIYSLGNFWFNSKELDTGLIQASVDTEGIRSLRFIPCRQTGCRTYPATGEEYNRILNDMRAMSAGVTIDDEGYISY